MLCAARLDASGHGTQGQSRTVNDCGNVRSERVGAYMEQLYTLVFGSRVHGRDV